jgi:peroxidase
MVPNIYNINVPAPAVTGVDIAASDLRRARLHGIPNYHDVRKVWFSANPSQNSLYGTNKCDADENTPSPDPLSCFLQLTSNCELAVKLRDYYGKLNRIDPLVGTLIEEPMKHSALGPTMTRIILDQFKRARDGDRYFSVCF